MDRAQALALLGVDDETDPAAIRRAYRRRIAESHPDVAGPAGTEQTALLTVAWALLRDGPPSSGEAGPPCPPPPAPVHDGDLSDGDLGDADQVVTVDAVGPDAFARLTEAASRVGAVSYIDRQLELLEIVVRFEGGPSCSVVMTMQGRADHTEVFVTMESIEAAPTPSSLPVAAALREELASVHRTRRAAD